MSEIEELKRPKFGSRYLHDDKDVFQFNAWDDIDWDEEQEKSAQIKIAENTTQLVEQNIVEELEQNANNYWNAFYSQHQDAFFKDRHWLLTEFSELNLNNNDRYSNQSISQEKCRILEIGCGVGNTVMPLLQANKHTNFDIYCCDFSSTAIDILKKHKDFDPMHCHPFVWDATEEKSIDSNFPVEQNSVDYVIMVFVLSAVSPEKMEQLLKNISHLLKPGGRLLFRDYGKYDLAQLRFNNGKCIKENFYVRGDKTRVYFFDSEELDKMFIKAGLKKVENRVDRRLQVNRARQLKMYRIWIQCKYDKICCK